MRRLVVGIVGAAAVMLAAPTSTEASAFVSITQGGTTLSCDTALAQSAANCATAAQGGTYGFTIGFGDTIGFSGTIGTFTFDSLTVGGNAPGTATNSFVTDTKLNVSTTAPGTVNVVFGEQGYTLPAGPNLSLSSSQTLNATTISTGGAATQTFTGCGDKDNGKLVAGAETCASTAPLNVVGPATTVSLASASPDLGFTRLATAFSLIGVQNITLTANTVASFTGTVAVNQVAEPASLALLGMGLLGVARQYRRRYTVV